MLEIDPELWPLRFDFLSSRNVILSLFIVLFPVLYILSFGLKVVCNIYIKIFFFYIFFISISVFWSDSVEDTLLAIIGIWSGFIVSIYIGRNYSLTSIVYSMVYSMLLVCFLSSILFLLNSDIALNDELFFRFKGIINHSQRFALQLAFVSIISFIYFWNSGNKFFLYSSIIFSFFIILTFTRAWTTFYVLTIILYIFNSINYRRKFYLVVLSLAFLPFVLNYSILDLYQRSDSDITELSGRSQLWNILYSDISDSPMLGHGFGSFREGVFQVNSWLPAHAHNMWLHLMYETGIFGTIILNVFIFISFFWRSRISDAVLKDIIKYLTFFILLSSLTGVILGRLIGPVYILYLSILFNISSNKN
ncbi:O-antigen ligase family protein [Algoriphagus sp. NG3]|uniref:O-antigen ligase family protein n=1 Tax=Algoriphagus sp. NG3 TaxID=3097546 RepID=UPI002A833248|nr:O-antigen ligase family protein [Algoriphagus sp. NG3]WPR77514.1 O-antigen ligase family protein [Algoriphagus sp. NG3]